MQDPIGEKRSERRSCFGPAETEHWIEAEIRSRIYRFPVLNLCSGGIGMLVREDQSEVLDTLVPGAVLRMDHGTGQGRMTLTVTVRHATPLDPDIPDGDHAVGFSLSI